MLEKTVIFTSPRSGSKFLRSSLNNHPNVFIENEFFRKDVPKTQGYLSVEKLFYNNIIDDKIREYDRVGFVWCGHFDSDIRQEEVKRLIILERKNKLEQFVSYKIAEKKGVWKGVESTEKITVDLDEYREFLNKVELTYRYMRKSRKGSYHNVWYEGLRDNFRETVESIYDYLEINKEVPKEGDTIRQEKRPLRDIILNYNDIKIYDRTT
jgi:LPS sulfotransferase NodH